MTPPPTGGATDEERLTITLAAFECVARLGFEGLRRKHVAAEAGIDNAELERLYPAERDLVAHVLDYVTRQFWGTMAPAGSPADRLHHHLDSLSRMISERPVLFLVLAELEVRAPHDPLVRTVIERDERGWRDALSSLFRDGFEQGTWAPGVTEDGAVDLVVATIKGVRLAPLRASTTLAQLEQVLLRERR